MKNAYQLAAEFRLHLLTRDNATRDQLLLAYRHSWKAIEEQLNEIATRIINTKGTPYLFAEQRRLHAIQNEVIELIRGLGEKASNLAVTAQKDAVASAGREAIQLIKAKVVTLPNALQAEIGGSFSTFPSKVVAEIVGVSHRHPIDEVFEELAKDLGQITTKRIKHALVRGVALGESPDRVVRRIMREVNATNGNPKRDPVVVRRLRMTVRNETFRAYRRATLATYQENDDVVQRWRWVSRKSPTTCIVCWAMDGKTFPLSSPFASHPGCRCVETPVLADEDDRYQTGPEAFDELEPGVQKSILGQKAFEAWDGNDDLEIGDFVAQKNSRTWGPSRIRLSVEDALRKMKRSAA